METAYLLWGRNWIC